MSVSREFILLCWLFAVLYYRLSPQNVLFHEKHYKWVWLIIFYSKCLKNLISVNTSIQIFLKIAQDHLILGVFIRHLRYFKTINRSRQGIQTRQGIQKDSKLMKNIWPHSELISLVFQTGFMIHTGPFRLIFVLCTLQYSLYDTFWGLNRNIHKFHRKRSWILIKLYYFYIFTQEIQIKYNNIHNSLNKYALELYKWNFFLDRTHFFDRAYELWSSQWICWKNI